MNKTYKQIVEDVYAADRKEKQWVDPKTGKTKKRTIQTRRIQFAASKLHQAAGSVDAVPEYLQNKDWKRDDKEQYKQRPDYLEKDKKKKVNKEMKTYNNFIKQIDLQENHVAIAMGNMMDDESGMVLTQLEQLERGIEMVRSYIGKDYEKQLPAWVQAKITLATEYVDTVGNYLSSKNEKVNEEVEQIDELSKTTLGSYVKNAARDVGASRKLSADFENTAKSARKQSMKDANKRLADKFKDTANKRHAGIGKAVERLTKEEVSLDEASYAGLEKEDKPGKVKTAVVKLHPKGVESDTVEGWKDPKKPVKEEQERTTMTKSYKEFMEGITVKTSTGLIHKGTYGYGGKGAAYGDTNYDDEDVDKKDKTELETGGGKKRGPKPGSTRAPRANYGNSKIHQGTLGK